MRILVVSDSHGNVRALRRALEAQPTAETVFFLGDGERDINAVQADFPEKNFVCVTGNCDFASFYPVTERRKIAGKNILACHGHTFHVKYGLEEYKDYARKSQTDIALFGHTHTPLTLYEDGLYVMNPGALKSFYGTYGVIDITSAGIVMNIVEIQT